MVNLSTPVIVGVGQSVERLDAPDFLGMSPVELAAAAGKKACADALSLEQLRTRIDTVATIRTFEDSGAGPAPFGKSNNFPRSVAGRLGIDPPLAIWPKAGGDSPQNLVTDCCERIANGRIRMALLAGAEAISTVRHLMATGQTRDFAESVPGEVEDHGMGLGSMVKRYLRTYNLKSVPPLYGLLENARRGRLHLSREDYAKEMGRLFSPLSKIAATNPYSSAAQQPYSAEELITVSERNRMIAHPYPLRLVSRDQVNQGAALLITSVGMAQELGIPESKWVYLHGYSALTERDILERADLGSSPAARLAAKAALDAAGVSVDDVAFFDFYSCFPIPVFNVAYDGLGLHADDPRPLTVTGGLPYFGGPGNNYSMHAIATMVDKLREQRGSFGFVGANGGFMSKYAAGVYSTRPAPWKTCDSAPLQASIDAMPAPRLAEEADGWGTVETYTVVYRNGEAASGTIIGRLADDRRFMANTAEDDPATLLQLLEADPIGMRVFVCSTKLGNRFAFSEERISELYPARPPAFRERYEYSLIERRGRVLEIVINRPEARNCLHPMANDELAEIMDAYLADPDLWIAIITGAGNEAFSTGNDLKYSASGKPTWMPKSGFAGLTHRPERSKPVIAAVNGYAMGGGLEICLACDLVVADETAQFALSEVKVGLIAAAGGLVRLPRQIPKKIATEMILTGRRIGAHEAQALGLVNRVVGPGQAVEAARLLAAEILEGSPTSVRLSLQVMNESAQFAGDSEALNCRSSALDELIASEDMTEGIFAFAQKRKPSWKNR